MTTLGRTRAATPATEAGGRLVMAGDAVPRLKPGCVPLSADRNPIYPPTSPPSRPPAEGASVVAGGGGGRLPAGRAARAGGARGAAPSGPGGRGGGTLVISGSTGLSG